MTELFNIDRDIEELRLELNACIDPCEREIIRAELEAARALRAKMEDRADIF